MDDAAPAPAPAPAPADPPALSIDDFRKVQLKVGRVIEASEHANADKLLVVKVDLGAGDVRQIVSGIKQWYAPDQLVGKLVVVVANLKPARLRGVESQGMVLAATSGGAVVLCTLEKEADPGSPVT